MGVVVWVSIATRIETCRSPWNVGQGHEATGHVVGVLHDDRDVGGVGVAVQPVALLAALRRTTRAC